MDKTGRSEGGLEKGRRGCGDVNSGLSMGEGYG